MILRIGPFLYRVHFVEDTIYHEGERCLGLCDNEKHEIHVATQMSFAQQVQVICHEYMEAWVYHFGQPRWANATPPTPSPVSHTPIQEPEDGSSEAQPTGAQLVLEKEACCDLFGLAMTQFVMDLIRQLDEFGREAQAMPTDAAPPGRSAASGAAPHQPSPDSPPQTGPHQRIAPKLADAAARAGLRVSRMYEP